MDIFVIDTQTDIALISMLVAAKNVLRQGRVWPWVKKNFLFQKNQNWKKTREEDAPSSLSCDACHCVGVGVYAGFKKKRKFEKKYF